MPVPPSVDAMPGSPQAPPAPPPPNAAATARRHEPRPPLARYGVAVIAALVAVAIAELLYASVGWITWLPSLGAVGVATWYGRVWAGLLAGALGAAVIAWLHLAPIGSLAVEPGADLVGLLTFVAVAAVMAALIDVLHAAGESALDAADRSGELAARSAQQAREAGAHAARLDLLASELREREARLAGIVGSVMDAILSVDEARHIVVFNAAAERMFGLPTAEALGSSLDRFLPGGFRGVRDGPAELDAMSGGAVRESGRLTPLTALRADGREFPVEATVSLATFGAERLYTLVMRDITERRVLEAQLLQAQKMEGIGQLAGGVAHDFNNILTVIKSYAEFLRAGLADREDLRADVEEVITATDRAVALTRQLLAFSRRQTMAPRLLDPNAIVRGMEAMLHRLLGEDIELVAPVAASPGLVRVDPGQLEQVLVNLTVNARDALEFGGLITIETFAATLTPDDVHEYATQSLGAQLEQPGEYVVLRVSDSGVGMDATTQAHIFEPFFTTKSEGHGTGLGLATVYGIVQQSGGHVRVRSAPQRGTTIDIYLPRHESAAADGLEIETVAEPVGGTETLLLVEDETAVRRSARRLLERAGYRVVEARHGADALLVWREMEGAIDLLVTDVRMPQLGGRELIAELRRQRPELPVLFISGYAADDTSEPATDGEIGALPAASLIAKPFTAEGLLRGVRQALDREAPDRGR